VDPLDSIPEGPSHQADWLEALAPWGHRDRYVRALPQANDPIPAPRGVGHGGAVRGHTVNNAADEHRSAVEGEAGVSACDGRLLCGSNAWMQGLGGAGKLARPSAREVDVAADLRHFVDTHWCRIAWAFVVRASGAGAWAWTKTA